MCKTPKRERFSKKFKLKSKTQILDVKRSVKSNVKIDKKRKKKKKLTLTRHSVNLNANQSIKDSFRLKIAKNKKQKASLEPLTWAYRVRVGRSTAEPKLG